MFHTLLESQHAGERHPAGTALSLLIHASIFTALLQLSTQAAPELQRAFAEKITFARITQEDAPPKPPEPVPEVEAVPAAVAGGPLPAKGFQVLSAPVGIPNVLPEIDFSKAVTDEADFSGKGVAGGVARGVVGGVVMKDPPAVVGGAAVEAPVYVESQVEKPASARPDNPPLKYPEALRRSAIEGTVTVTFVIDTSGRADMNTLRVVNSTHDLFTDAVKVYINTMRFYPAEIGGRKVRMLVSQPITFSLLNM